MGGESRKRRRGSNPPVQSVFEANPLPFPENRESLPSPELIPPSPSTSTSILGLTFLSFFFSSHHNRAKAHPGLTYVHCFVIVCQLVTDTLFLRRVESNTFSNPVDLYSPLQLVLRHLTRETRPSIPCFAPQHNRCEERHAPEVNTFISGLPICFQIFSPSSLSEPSSGDISRFRQSQTAGRTRNLTALATNTSSKS